MRLFATHADRLLAARRVSPLVIVALLGLYASWDLLLTPWLFASGVAEQVIDATHGVVGDTLLASSITLALVVAITCGLGRLRARDLGLSRRGVVVGALATFACWGLAQLVLVVAAVASGDPLAPTVHAENGREMFGQLFGNALAEEIAMRGFLFVQLVLLLGRTRKAWVIGALAAAAVFGASHIPIRIAFTDLRGIALAGDLVWLAWNGLMLELVYVRTGHLEVCVGFHALWNEPFSLVASPVPARPLMLALQVAIVVAWPYLSSRRTPAGERRG